jgi:hypothetical protein
MGKHLHIHTAIFQRPLGPIIETFGFFAITLHIEKQPQPAIITHYLRSVDTWIQ